MFLIGPSGGRADRLRSDAASLATLAAITGRLGKPGRGLLLLLGRSNVRGACEMGAAPDRLPGYERIDDGEARQRMQQLWGRPVPVGRGLDAQSMLESVSGLIVLADDPAAVLPMGQRARAALERMEFLVVFDAFVTPAVNAAHAILPIASLAETRGTLTNMEGRVQRVRRGDRSAGRGEGLAGMCWLNFAPASMPGCEWSSATDVLREIAQAAPRYSKAVPQVLDDGWGSSLVEEAEWASLDLQASPTEVLTSPERPYVLARDGASDWGSDPLISFSPTLNREYQSERKAVSERSGRDERRRMPMRSACVRAGG